MIAIGLKTAIANILFHNIEITLLKVLSEKAAILRETVIGLIYHI